MRPFDAREAADQADIVGWVASGQQLFRTAPPATPPKHLVVYFVPVDAAAGACCLAITASRGCGCRPAVTSRRARTRARPSAREAGEELGISAEFHPALGGRSPFFLTVTPTDDAGSHLDVDLWFVAPGRARDAG